MIPIIFPKKIKIIIPNQVKKKTKKKIKMNHQIIIKKIRMKISLIKIVMMIVVVAAVVEKAVKKNQKKRMIILPFQQQIVI